MRQRARVRYDADDLAAMDVLPLDLFEGTRYEGLYFKDARVVEGPEEEK